MAISYMGLRPITRIAKPAREIPTPGVYLESAVLISSATVIPFEHFWLREDVGATLGTLREPTIQMQGLYEVEIRIQNLGPSEVYLVWGSWSTDPAAPDVAGPPGYSALPTTRVPPLDTRSFMMSATSAPFHLIVGIGNPDSTCVVDRFLRRHPSL